MYSLIYVSAATQAFSSEKLRDLLEHARKNNAAQGITGMLLYHDGDFMQLLEGPKPAVLATYEKVCRDPRHTHLMVLMEGDTTERHFSDWTMGFKNLGDKDVFPKEGVNQFLNTRFTGTEFSDNPTSAQLLLLSFKENLR